MFDLRQLQQPTRTAMLRSLVVLLAWSQVSYAAHQFEHSLDEPAESCAVCLQLERHDDALPDTDCDSPAPPVSLSAPLRAQTDCRSSAAAPYLSRASP